MPEPVNARSIAESYERYFVPSIGAPAATDLVDTVALRAGERVLDVACGTGVVTRLAAERVGSSGSAAGLDPNAAMLAVARAATPEGTSIDWYETTAEAMPLPDESFDVVLCQMGLQFIPDRPAALREMHRVLAPGGRLALCVPGPIPRMFESLARSLSRHAGVQGEAFVGRVFSLHEPAELRELLTSAGFHRVEVSASPRQFALPPANEFLWQYIDSTPLTEAVAGMNESQRAAFEREVCAAWSDHHAGDGMALTVGMTTATAEKGTSS